MTTLTEADVEQAALAWLEGLGWRGAQAQVVAFDNPAIRRTISGETLADAQMPELQVLVRGVFKKHRFLALLRDFIAFEDDGGALAKKMAGYHRPLPGAGALAPRLAR